MGMYTEIVVTAKIKNNPELVAILKYMLGDSLNRPEKLPNHRLFLETERWSIMLRCQSYYFVPRSIHIFDYDEIGKYWCLVSRSDFKNYHNEVDFFFDWLEKHCLDDRQNNEMLGYSRYEEDREPKIHYTSNKD